MFELGDQMKPTLTLCDDKSWANVSLLDEYKARPLLQNVVTLAFVSFPLPATKE